MKKSNLFFVFIFCFQISINAQSSFGVIGGINHSALNISDKDPSAEIESVSSYTIGLLLNYDITESYSITIQPRYIVKGEDVKWNQTYIWDWAENRFNYLELPIYFQAKLNYSSFKPHIFSGFNIGYLFSATAKINSYKQNATPYYPPTVTEIFKITVTDDYNKLDLALDFGIGIEYLINSKYSLSLDGRYSFGLLNLAKDGTSKFRGIQGLLGFLYKL